MTETRKTNSRNSSPEREMGLLMATHIPKGAYLICLPPLSKANRHPCSFSEFSSVEAAEVAKAAILNADRARNGPLTEGDFVIVPR
jgi:hypothetical protein